MNEENIVAYRLYCIDEDGTVTNSYTYEAAAKDCEENDIIVGLDKDGEEIELP